MEESYYFLRAALTSKMTQYAQVGFISNMTAIKFGREVVLNVKTEKPIQSKSQLSDYIGGATDLFHQRIIEVLQNMGTEGVKYFPVRLDGWKENIYDDYICVFAENNMYKLLDEELSSYSYRNRMYRIGKYVIDKEKLADIPLGKRLCMHVEEMLGYCLYHQSVVDAIMALEPVGMSFYNVEKK